MTASTAQPELFGASEKAAHHDGHCHLERLVRCVSLWQPWASLIAAGLKTVETRSWPAPTTILGSRIAIHAAKTNKGMWLAAQDKELWKACLEALPFDEQGFLPRGVLVATALVEASIPTERLNPDIFGDFSAGRFGWMLADIEPLKTPIPAKGAQGVFMATLDASNDQDELLRPKF